MSELFAHHPELACGCVPMQPPLFKSSRSERKHRKAAIEETTPRRDPHQEIEEMLMREARGNFEIVRDPSGRVA